VTQSTRWALGKWQFEAVFQNQFARFLLWLKFPLRWSTMLPSHQTFKRKLFPRPRRLIQNWSSKCFVTRIPPPQVVSWSLSKLKIADTVISVLQVPSFLPMPFGFSATKSMTRDRSQLFEYCALRHAMLLALITRENMRCAGASGQVWNRLLSVSLLLQTVFTDVPAAASNSKKQAASGMRPQARRTVRRAAICSKQLFSVYVATGMLNSRPIHWLKT